MARDVYLKLLRHINENYFFSSPESETTLEILRAILTAEEATLCCQIPLATRGRITALGLARITGRQETVLRETLEALARRGILYAFLHPKDAEINYSLWPIDPGGMLENIFADGVPHERKETVKQLYRAYWDSGYWNLVSSSRSPIFRIIPSETAIDGASDVLVFDQVQALVDKARRISTVKCFCRTLEDGKCGKPMDTCFYFDAWADYAIRYRNAKPLDRKAALAILQEAERAGLVHLTTNFQKGITAVCNCCPCCCHVLRGYLQLENRDSFIRSNYEPTVDVQSCEDCGLCREICPARAIGRAEEGAPSAAVDSERCIGCGLCASNCPAGSIRLVRIRNHVPPQDFQEAIEAYKRDRHVSVQT